MANLKDCPCSGKSMTLHTGAWILLTLHRHEGIHGYEIAKRLKAVVEEFGVSLNITGLYRHLKALEGRGMVESWWEQPSGGMAKRKYALTEEGKQCLWAWINTIQVEFALIVRFFEELKQAFPSLDLPENDLLKTHLRPITKTLSG